MEQGQLSRHAFDQLLTRVWSTAGQTAGSARLVKHSWSNTGQPQPIPQGQMLCFFCTGVMSMFWSSVLPSSFHFCMPCIHLSVCSRGAGKTWPRQRPVYNCLSSPNSHKPVQHMRFAAGTALGLHADEWKLWIKRTCCDCWQLICSKQLPYYF